MTSEIILYGSDSIYQFSQFLLIHQRVTWSFWKIKYVVNLDKLNINLLVSQNGLSIKFSIFFMRIIKITLFGMSIF